MLKKVNIYDGNRFDFEGHINEFLLRREEARALESFLVVVEPGKQTHLHSHQEMEQLFLVVAGQGVVSDGGGGQVLTMNRNDLIFVPTEQPHQIRAVSTDQALVYVCINGFQSGALAAATSLAHAEGVVKRYNMGDCAKRTLWRRPIMIAGSSGHLGTALAGHYLDQRNTVWGFDAEPAPGLTDGAHAARWAFRGVDLRDERGVEAAFRSLVEEAGSVPRALICAAGMTDRHASVLATSADAVRAQIDANFVSNFNIARTYARSVTDRGLSGSIVFLGSAGATRSHRHQCAYDAAKAALESLCRTMALELSPKGISVNTVAIGPIEDSPSSRKDAVHRDALRQLVPIGRYASLDEVCRIIDAVVSMETPYFTGQTLTADGGLTVQLRPAAIERTQ